MRDDAVNRLPDTHRLGDLPDVVLPSQFFDTTGQRTLSSEQRLLFAVLIDAINIVRDYRARPSERKRGSFDEVSAWLFAEVIEGPMSFVHVCEAVGVEPDCLRRRLKEFVLCRDDSSLVRLRFKESGRQQRVTVHRDRRVKRTKLPTAARLSTKR